MKENIQAWLDSLAADYFDYLQKQDSPSWADYTEWLEHKCFWAYLGTYKNTCHVEFLKESRSYYNCDLFDAWVFLVWFETIYRFTLSQGQVPTAELITGQIAAYLHVPEKKLCSLWEKRTTSRTQLLHNPALQGAISLANLSNLLYWLGAEDKEKAQVRGRSFMRVLLEGAIHVAWADKKLLFDEKEGLRYQILAAGLNGQQTDNLLKLLNKKQDTEAAFQEYLGLLKRSTLTSFEQRILLAGATVSSLLDGSQSEMERRYLEVMAATLGLDNQFLQTMAVEVTQVLKDCPSVVQPSEANWILERLQRKLSTDLTDSLQENAAIIWIEIQKTGDLFMLLSKAASGMNLSEFERERIKHQLMELAKVVPALAIFMLPGGMVFLGILIKVLPFNIMPTAFNKKEESNEI